MPGPCRNVGLGGICIALALLCATVAVAVGAEPTETPLAILEAGDPRSEGVGPGLVGSPVLVLSGVILLGIATALVTVLLARLTRRD